MNNSLIIKYLTNHGIDIRKYVNKPIIFDTGPLLFYLAGSKDPNKIGKEKISQGYTKEEFELLINFASLFSEIIVTPNILAECSNLINRDINKNKFEPFMSSSTNLFEELNEKYIEKNVIIKNSDFPRLGFTDISLMECAKNSGNLLLTKDLSLKLACISKSIPVLHFDTLRELSWFPN